MFECAFVVPVRGNENLLHTFAIFVTADFHRFSSFFSIFTTKIACRCDEKSPSVLQSYSENRPKFCSLTLKIAQSSAVLH